MELYKAFATTDTEAFRKAYDEYCIKYKGFIIRTRTNATTREYIIEVFAKTTNEELGSPNTIIITREEQNLIEIELETTEGKQDE